MIEEYRSLARRIMDEEADHGDVGKSLLVDYYKECALDHSERRALLTIHIDAGIRCIGKPGSRGDVRAVELGLKTASSKDILARYRDYVADVASAIGESDVASAAGW